MKLADFQNAVIYSCGLIQPRDNPHELMDVRCTYCRRREFASRESLNDSRWSIVERVGEEDQVYCCPDCYQRPEFD